jgi:hypothetical protein
MDGGRGKSAIGNATDQPDTCRRRRRRRALSSSMDKSNPMSFRTHCHSHCHIHFVDTSHVHSCIRTYMYDDNEGTGVPSCHSQSLRHDALQFTLTVTVNTFHCEGNATLTETHMTALRRENARSTTKYRYVATNDLVVVLLHIVGGRGFLAWFRSFCDRFVPASYV